MSYPVIDPLPSRTVPRSAISGFGCRSGGKPVVMQPAAELDAKVARCRLASNTVLFGEVASPRFRQSRRAAHEQAQRVGMPVIRRPRRTAHPAGARRRSRSRPRARRRAPATHRRTALFSVDNGARRRPFSAPRRARSCRATPERDIALVEQRHPQRGAGEPIRDAEPTSPPPIAIAS